MLMPRMLSKKATMALWDSKNNRKSKRPATHEENTALMCYLAGRQKKDENWYKKYVESYKWREAKGKETEELIKHLARWIRRVSDDY